MEAVSSSETSVNICQFTRRRNIPEAVFLKTHYFISQKKMSALCSFQSRYGTYDGSSGNDDLMFSLDSTPALQGVLSDGLICSVM
jgi:hypothetical protein